MFWYASVCKSAFCMVLTGLNKPHGIRMKIIVIDFYKKGSNFLIYVILSKYREK